MPMIIGGGGIEAALNLQRVELPIELQRTFHGLCNTPLFYVAYCKKLNSVQKVQRRVMVCTLDHVYMCHPNGDLLRCVTYDMISRVVHDPIRQQLALIVPSEYDMAIEVPNSYHFIEVVETLRSIRPETSSPLVIQYVLRRRRDPKRDGLPGALLGYPPTVLDGEDADTDGEADDAYVRHEYDDCHLTSVDLLGGGGGGAGMNASMLFASASFAPPAAASLAPDSLALDDSSGSDFEDAYYKDIAEMQKLRKRRLKLESAALQHTFNATSFAFNSTSANDPSLLLQQQLGEEEMRSMSSFTGHGSGTVGSGEFGGGKGGKRSAKQRRQQQRIGSCDGSDDNDNPPPQGRNAPSAGALSGSNTNGGAPSFAEPTLLSPDSANNGGGLLSNNGGAANGFDGESTHVSFFEQLRDWWYYFRQAVPMPLWASVPEGVVVGWNDRFYKDPKASERVTRRRQRAYRAHYEHKLLFKWLFWKERQARERMSIHNPLMPPWEESLVNVQAIIDDDPFVFGENIAGQPNEIRIGKPPYEVRLAKPAGWRLCLHTGRPDGDEEEYEILNDDD